LITKNFPSVKIEIKDEYTLITNLKKDTYNDDEIKNIYHKRWYDWLKPTTLHALRV